MKDVFFIYEGCCLYEIVTLGYFMRYSGCDVAFCAPSDGPVRAMEGFTVLPDLTLSELEPGEVRSFILPGGAVSAVNTEEVRDLLRDLRRRGALLAAICAGVDVLDDAGILKGVRSTHSVEEDAVRDGALITARANAHVDFAILAADALGLFADEADRQETIAFWKYNKRMQ